MERGLRLSLLIAGIGGLAMRIRILAGPLGELDADEAVTALMAERMLDGKPALFYWGQQYGGTIDSILTAPALAVTGSAVWAAKAVMIAFQLVACLVVWRIGRRIYDERAGLVAAAVFWVFSPAVVWWSTKTRGFYGASLVLSLLTILLVVRLVQRPANSEERADRNDLLAIGFVVGIAWWTSPIAFFSIGPAVLVGLVQRRDLWPDLRITIIPFVLGGIPWWVFNLLKGFSSLESPAETTTSFGDRLEGLVTVMVPMLTGLRQPFSADWVLGTAVAAVVLSAVVVAAWRLRDRSWIPVVVIVGYPLVAAVSATSEYVGEPRYGYLLAPIIALLVGGVSTRSPIASALVPVTLFVTTAFGVGALTDLGVERRLDNYDLAPPDTAPLINELEARGVDVLYAEYWLAYRITFESDLIAAPTSSSRDQKILEAALAADRPPVAFYRDSDSLHEFVRVFGTDPFERVDLDYFVVFVPR